MIYLTDDTLSYLTEIILDNNGTSNLSSFLVCHRIKLISTKYIRINLY